MYDGKRPFKTELEGMMPDDWDRENIRALISNYHRKHPKDIPRAIHQGREAPDTQYGKVNTVIGHHVMELPEPLAKEIELAYPMMFRDPKQFQWFKKNFKSLLL